jgi:Holliday junction DNA helicase RuvB
MASTVKLAIPRFTLVGATTRAGLLTGPMRDRFGITGHLGFYTLQELTRIVLRSASILKIRTAEDGASEIARRSRGTPRIANRLLRRVRDFAEVRGTGVITHPAAVSALESLEVDACGLDAMDRRILKVLVEKFSGGPVGVETLAVAVQEEVDTLTDVVEPYLIQTGFLQHTPRGRLATPRAYEHLGFPKPKRERDLF